MFLNTQKNISYNLPLKGAIVGFGGVAEYAHVPLFQKDSRFSIVAVVEPDPSRIEAAKRVLKDVKIYTNIYSLFEEEDLDFIDICSPPAYHAEAIIEACKNNVNVICEKPLVTSLDELKKVMEAYNKSNVVLFCVNNWKYAPIWSKTIELVSKGYIGKVQEISLFVLRTPKSGGGVTNWRKVKNIAGGGILMDHGWHHIYFINSIIKDEPILISAKMRYAEPCHHKLEEEVQLNINYKTVKVNLFLTWRSTFRKNYGYIVGDKGKLIIDDDHIILKNNGSMLRYNFSPPLSKGSHHLEWMIPVIDNFFEELTGKNTGGNIKEAIQCLHLISLAYKSFQNGCSSIEVCSIFNA